jgi:hypothetical protein
MGDTKPLGSEKLKGDEKLKRILELTYFNKPKKSTSNPKPDLVKESASGVFGIVKEKDGYYVKKGLNENSLDYIGGLFMKNKNRFSSYGEALKRMELLSGQENLQEATKFVLKQNKPKQEAAAPAPTVDTEVPPTEPPAAEPEIGSELGGDTAPVAGEDGQGTTDQTGKRSDYMAEIQKYAGKLGQQLRDEHERMESDDIKYVLNMIISAVDLDKLDDNDIEEIAKKFEREENEEGGGDEPWSDSEATPAPSSDTDSELGENMSKLSEFINSSVGSQENEIDLSKYADLGNVEETKEIDMDEIKNEINSRIGETLSKYFK